MKLAVLNTVTCIFYVKYKQMYFDTIVLFMVSLARFKDDLESIQV